MVSSPPSPWPRPTHPHPGGRAFSMHGLVRQTPSARVIEPTATLRAATLGVVRTTARALVASVWGPPSCSGRRFNPRRRWGGRVAARVPAGSSHCAKGGGPGVRNGGEGRGCWEHCCSYTHSLTTHPLNGARDTHTQRHNLISSYYVYLHPHPALS